MKFARACLSFVLAAATLRMGACSVGGPQEDLIVAIRDAKSHQPIGGATVAIETIEPRNPLSVSGVAREMLGSELPSGPEGVTSADGTVTLLAYTQLPCNVVVTVPGYGVHSFFFGDHPAVVSDGSWQEPPVEDGPFGSKAFQARFTKPAAPVK